MTRSLGAVLLAASLFAGCAAAPTVPVVAPRVQTPAFSEAPERDRWQKPRELVSALGVTPGMQVADIGTGSGYFVPYLREAVMPGGRVVAQDIDAKVIARLEQRIERENLTGVEARLGEAADPKLEPDTYDLVVIVDTFHHIEHPEKVLASLALALVPGGRIVIVEFDRSREIPRKIAGPRHKASAMETVETLADAGYCVSRAYDLLPYQWVLEFRREPCDARYSPRGEESGASAIVVSRDRRMTHVEDSFGVVAPR
jgi:ubiquinone/menaquinone biosynthesis C-methylase UbiE